MSTDPLATGLLRRDGTGIFTVVIGRRWTDRLLARWAGHRRSGQVRVGLTVSPLPLGGELWTRSFDGHEVASTVVWDHDTGTLVERFRGMRLELSVVAAADEVRAELCSAAVALGPVTVPLPASVSPVVTVSARQAVTPQDEALSALGLHLRVEIRTRGGRPVLTYEGLLS